VLALAALSLLFGFGGDARADVRRLETIGAVPIVAGVRPQRAPRDAAILQAQHEAVTQVAREILLHAEPGPGWDQDGSPGDGSTGPDLAQVLGRDMGRYTSRFRILEDRGEGPVTYSDAPDARAEYVVLVEVQVDVDRVRTRLVEAGLVAPAGAAPEGNYFVLEVRGLSAYPAYAALRDLIVTGAGARSVVPLSMARDWVVLRVESEDSGTEFLDKLLASAPPELDLLPLEAEPERLRLSVRWTPPDPVPDA
jgi:hypothetical protein